MMPYLHLFVQTFYQRRLNMESLIGHMPFHAAVTRDPFLPCTCSSFAICTATRP